MPFNQIQLLGEPLLNSNRCLKPVLKHYYEQHSLFYLVNCKLTF